MDVAAEALKRAAQAPLMLPAVQCALYVAGRHFLFPEQDSLLYVVSWSLTSLALRRLAFRTCFLLIRLFLMPLIGMTEGGCTWVQAFFHALP